MFICRNLKTKIVLIPKISAVCSISLKMSDEKKLKIEANTIGKIQLVQLPEKGKNLFFNFRDAFW